ncbi:queuosine precursor transporter [Halegenticoccus tardaugens]|uniref:queuosine precursor transporter n=1 Tax=Halegenticoccus tardaugens TaxID=2071624 RepID=UPI00100B763E|nr:queuosine precursor transporter [Halegenticoccus tardaugens]
MSEARDPPSVAPIALVGLFVTALVTAQLVSAKLISITLPLVGVALSMPGGTLAYAATYFASDCISELYGRRFARRVVNVGFAMNLVMLGLVWLTIRSPAAAGSIDPGTFATVLGAGTNIVLGSLCAYLVSQNWDVIAFHRIREWTDGEALWLRNVGSTATSQLIDTVIFTVVAFALAPALLDIGAGLGAEVIVGLVVGQYVAKLSIAVLDTPLVYAAVGWLRARERGESAGSPSVD